MNKKHWTDSIISQLETMRRVYCENIDRAVISLQAIKNQTQLCNTKREKNSAAVLLGRLGGKKGGFARATVLSAARRTEIARKAAQARWEKKNIPSLTTTP